MAKSKVNKQNNLIWMVAVGVVAVALVGVFALSAQAQGVRGIFCKVGILDCEFSVEDYTAVLENLLPDEEAALGSGSSHATDPSMKVGGVERFYDRQIMRQGTTTVCSFISPAATSTVTGGLVNFDVGSTSATIVSVAKATTAFATTTTLITDVALAANIKGTIHIDPAVAATLDATQIISPLNFVNIGIQEALADGGVEGEATYYLGAAPVGTCLIEFMTI